MSKEEAIAYFDTHREDLYELCEKFNLKSSYENREQLLSDYNRFKELAAYFKDKGEEYNDQYNNCKRKVENLEKTYHIFEPDFNETFESRWVDKHYNSELKNVFDYRKSMYGTQDIWHDYELNTCIELDMGHIWAEKEGQDGMYDSFPFSFSRESTVRTTTHYSEYLKTNVTYTTKLIRCYALGGFGGIAIIEERTYRHYEDEASIRSELQDSYSSRQKIVTLGEDDGYHFLNSRHIYEDNYGTNEDFIQLLNMVLEEYEHILGK